MSVCVRECECECTCVRGREEGRRGEVERVCMCECASA